MHVKVNGKDEQVDAGTTLADLVARYKLQPKFVAVEVNFELVPRADLDSTVLNEGDAVEIVTFVGGG